MQKPKLRVGLLLNSLEFDAWAYRMVEIIRHSGYAEIVLIVLNTGPAEAAKKGLAARIGSGRLWSGGIRRLLLALERFLVDRTSEIPNAFARIDGTALLGGVETIRVHPRRTRYSDYIEGDDLAAVRARDVDVLVRLGFRILRGGILHAARHGVWSYHHGDNRINRGGPPGYWEVMESWPETGSVLQILTEDLDNGLVLCRSNSSTRDLSLTDSRSNYYWKSLSFLPRKLKELHEAGAEKFFARVREPGAELRFYDRRLYRAPTNGELFVLLCGKLLTRLWRKWYELGYFNQWCLLYDIRSDISSAPWRFSKILPPKDRDWADPFVVARDGKYYIFVEELLYAAGKGHVSVIVMDRNGRIEPAVKVLETPHHLSYPFVFEFEGGYYMAPESSRQRKLALYKCTAFPHRWEFQKYLIEDSRIADATLFPWQGKWWMFANVAEVDGTSNWDELHVYHSDSPLSADWTPHPRNPVVSDVRTARPAGRLFERHGRLYRPSQNCSRHYGYGFNICEITRLTETEYEERMVSRVEPRWDRNIVSTHTFNYEDGLTIIDAQVRRRKYSGIGGRIRPAVHALRDLPGMTARVLGTGEPRFPRYPFLGGHRVDARLDPPVSGEERRQVLPPRIVDTDLCSNAQVRKQERFRARFRKVGMNIPEVSRVKRE